MNQSKTFLSTAILVGIGAVVLPEIQPIKLPVNEKLEEAKLGRVFFIIA